MSDTIIKVENLSKRYRIGATEQGYKTFREAIIDGFKAPIRNLRRLRKLTKFDDNPGKEQKTMRNEPTLTHPASFPITSSPGDSIWALRDISFEVKRGEVFGIIGRNGAGKSTLLKILSRITEPTSGDVKIYGRVSSLLEVGTGFHQELTGRENIFLNGAILGMRKKEIDGKFDQIVDFAEIEQFIDTPVKRYSTGMSVRLAFAVAAHLEPEILLVDEVLAVGDIAFQKKCIGKMSQVSRAGRTVLFVSHNMQAIASMCTKVILLNNGHIEQVGKAQDIISRYLESQGSEIAGLIKWPLNSAPGDGVLRLFFIRVIDTRSSVRSDFLTSEDITIEFGFKLTSVPEGLRIGFDLVTQEGVLAFRSFHNDSYDSWRGELGIGNNVIRCTIPANLLNEGKHDICTRIGIHMVRWIVRQDGVISFRMLRANKDGEGYSGSHPGTVAPRLSWRSVPASEINVQDKQSIEA
ncbi:MAG: ATP-binding cassette domain-containing protein [Deltaproteobacteria bacterium]|nr:ATP-binding cassette domain-containing protein [Deltaproteobacteria bacterium]